MTPRAFSAPSSESNAFRAPRSLNEPVRCKSSRFSQIVRPVISESTGAIGHGVRRSPCRIRRRAASTSARLREDCELGFMDGQLEFEKQKALSGEAQGFGKW